MPSLRETKEAFAELNEDRALPLVKDALAAKMPAFDILTACQEGMTEVGNRFECQDYFVSDLMMSSEIFKQIGILPEGGLKAGGSRPPAKSSSAP